MAFVLSFFVHLVFQKRLQRELMTMVKEAPDGITLDDATKEGNDISQ